MHQYLRAIGFSEKMSRKELDIMMKKMILKNDKNDVVREEDGTAFVEIHKKFGENIGITLCGELDQDGFHQEYYFPYLEGSEVSTREDLMVEQSGSGETYTAACEDPRVGVTLIFFPSECSGIKEREASGEFDSERTEHDLNRTVAGGKNPASDLSKCDADGI